MNKNNIIMGMILISLSVVTALAEETKNKPSQDKNTFEEYFLTDGQRQICEELSTNDIRNQCKTLLTKFNASNFENQALLQQAQELVNQDAQERFKQTTRRNFLAMITISVINGWLNS